MYNPCHARLILIIDILLFFPRRSPPFSSCRHLHYSTVTNIQKRFSPWIVFSFTVVKWVYKYSVEKFCILVVLTQIMHSNIYKSHVNKTMGSGTMSATFKIMWIHFCFFCLKYFMSCYYLLFMSHTSHALSKNSLFIFLNG